MTLEASFLTIYLVIMVVHFVVLQALSPGDEAPAFLIGLAWPLVWAVILPVGLFAGLQYCWRHSRLLGLLRRERPNKHPRLPGAAIILALDYLLHDTTPATYYYWQHRTVLGTAATLALTYAIVVVAWPAMYYVLRRELRDFILPLRSLARPLDNAEIGTK